MGRYEGRIVAGSERHIESLVVSAASYTEWKSREAGQCCRYNSGAGTGRRCAAVNVGGYRVGDQAAERHLDTHRVRNVIDGDFCKTGSGRNVGWRFRGAG